MGYTNDDDDEEARERRRRAREERKKMRDLEESGTTDVIDTNRYSVDDGTRNTYCDTLERQNRGKNQKTTTRIRLLMPFSPNFSFIY